MTPKILLEDLPLLQFMICPSSQVEAFETCIFVFEDLLNKLTKNSEKYWGDKESIKKSKGKFLVWLKKPTLVDRSSNEWSYEHVLFDCLSLGKN